MSRILQIADTHLYGATAENVEHSMTQILALAEELRPDLIAHCGDLSHSASALTPDIAIRLRSWICDLAKIAPVIVIDGNHDKTKDPSKAGVLRGALSLSEAGERVTIVEMPRVLTGIKGVDFPVACLPYPNKAMLAAMHPEIAPSEINAKASSYLEDAVRWLAAQMPSPGPLMFHGSIEHAKTGTEQSMSTDVDVVLRASAIPDVFPAVLCGHIHKHQVIAGRIVYAGSHCPLDHGEENHEHGVVLWETAGELMDREDAARGWQPVFQPGIKVRLREYAKTWTHRFIPLEPKHRLLTINAHDGPPYPQADVTGARVRVLTSVARGVDAASVIGGYQEWYGARGAHDVRVVIEREAEDRTGGRPSVSAETSLPTLLAAYGERNPDAQPYSERLVEFGMTEIEPRLPQEARSMLRGGDWRPVAIELVNFTSFGKVERLEFERLGRLVNLDGPNHNGKSNLLDSIGYAFWGKTPREPASSSSYVRIGSDEMLVAAEFEAEGALWRVRRGVSLNGSGKPKGSLLLEKYGPSVIAETLGWMPASNGNSRETQEQIERLVGSWEMYLCTRYAAQGDIDRLLHLTPAKLKDALQAALGAGVFEHRERLARERAVAAEREADRLSAEVAVLERRAAGLDAASEAVDAAEGAVVAGEQRCYDAGLAMLDSMAAAERADTDVRTAEAEEERRAATRARLAKIAARSNELLSRRTDLAESVRLAEGRRALLESHETNRAELSRLTLLRDQALAREEVLAGLVREHGEARKQEIELARRKDARRAQGADDWKRRTRERLAVRQALERQVADARESASLLETVPFGEKCVEARCQLLNAAVRARDGMPALQRDVDELIVAQGDDEAAERDRLRDDLAELEVHIAGLSERAEELAVSIGKQRSQIEPAFNHAAWSDLQAQVAAFDADACRERIAAADRAQGEVAALDRELEGLHLEAREVEAELDPEPASVLESLRSEAERAARALVEARAAHEALREEHGRLERALAVARASYEAICVDARAADEARQALAQAQEAVNIARIFARAMSRDGIPFLMLERAIPALESFANEFLADEDLRIEIEPVRDLVSGEQKSEVTVRYRDGLGLQDLARSSGEQTMKLGIALRFALARVQAEAHGISATLVLWDEGFGACDAVQKVGCARILARVAQWSGRVLFVSHDEEVRAAADSRIAVVIRDGASVVECVA